MLSDSEYQKYRSTSLSVSPLILFEYLYSPVLLSPVFPGGFGISKIRHSHRHTGSDLQRDKEALLRPIVQSGPELQRRGLGHREGGLQAEGNNDEVLCAVHLILMSNEGR